MNTSVELCTIDVPTSLHGHPLMGPPPKPFIRGIIEGFYGPPWSAGERRELLRTLAADGLDTYVYAPKDDLKHRKEWREEYEKEEADELQTLIEYARSLGLNFVYALSPGADIEYAEGRDLALVKAKMDQLRRLGCEAFALLFDDIEYVLTAADAAAYGTPANAQVAVANECYTYLGSPAHFYFCPTEYCSTRAKPSLMESDYLRTIGDRLHPGIEIFWTGFYVVAGVIAEENVRSVAMVLKRKPLIWDNLYANDYDTKRVFLGPFKGRGQSLKRECAGILLNPNCQFDLNRPALMSFTDWLRAKQDEPDASAALPISPAAFVPLASFERALQRWMKELIVPFTSTVEVIDFSSSSGSSVNTNTASSTDKTLRELGDEEPMEHSPSLDSDVSMDDPGRLVTYQSAPQLTLVQLRTLAHCYFLPFDHGPAALEILNGVLWLCRHADVMAPGYAEEPTVEDDEQEKVATRDTWTAWHKQVQAVIQLIYGAFTAISATKFHNADLAQYASDAAGALVVADAVLRWLADGHADAPPDFEREVRWKQPMYGEPWGVSFGFVEDLASALLPRPLSPSVLFSHRERTPMKALMAVRTMRSEDLVALASVVPEEARMERKQDEQAAACFEWTPRHCFVAEDAGRGAQLLGAVCGLIDVFDYYVQMKSYNDDEGEQTWLPPLPTDPGFRTYFGLWLGIERGDNPLPVAKRLIQTLATTMAYEGLTSLYTTCQPGEHERVALLLSLNFVELTSTHTDKILLGLRLTSEDGSPPSEGSESEMGMLEEEMEKESKQHSPAEDREEG